MSRRRRRVEEPENHERWMVSYADFLTLLFAFFVVMYALSTVNEGKYRVLSDSLIAAFQNPPRTLEPIQVGDLARTRQQAPMQVDQVPHSMPIPPQLITLQDLPHGQDQITDDAMKSSLERMSEDILESMGELIDQGLVTVRRTSLWLEVELNTNILFRSGSEQLHPEAEGILRKLAATLAPANNPIRVEGFADDVPINTLRYASNWELSAGRAARVVRLLANAGVDPSRLAAVGFGEHRPVADNASAAGRARNRRVALVVLAGQDSRYEMDILRDSSVISRQVLSPPATEAAP